MDPLENIVSITGDCQTSVSHCSTEDGDRFNHKYFEVSFSLRSWMVSKISVTVIRRNVWTACNALVRKISLLKQQFFVAIDSHFHRRHTMRSILNTPTLKYVTFLRKYKGKQFLWTRNFDIRCICNPTS